MAKRIGDEEEVDRQWLALEAERRAIAFDREKVLIEQLRRRRREDRPLAQRLATVMAQALTLQTSSSVDYERDRISGGEKPSGKPPSATTLDLTGHLRVIEARVKEMERELDAWRGLAVAPRRASMLGVDKDRELFGGDYAGMHNRDVADAAPWLGSERTIRRLRALRGFDSWGHPRETRSRAS